MVELVFRCGKDQLRSLVNSRVPLRTNAVANNAQEYNKWTVLVPFNYPQTCSHVTRWTHGLECRPHGCIKTFVGNCTTSMMAVTYLSRLQDSRPMNVPCSPSHSVSTLRCSRILFRRAIIIIYPVWECVHILFMPACIVFALLFYLFITLSLFIEALPFMCASVLCKTAFRWHKNELSRKLCRNFVNHRCAQQQVEPLSMTSHIMLSQCRKYKPKFEDNNNQSCQRLFM